MDVMFCVRLMLAEDGGKGQFLTPVALSWRGKRANFVHWTGGYVDSTALLDVVAKRKIPNAPAGLLIPTVKYVASQLPNSAIMALTYMQLY